MHEIDISHGATANVEGLQICVAKLHAVQMKQLAIKLHQ